MNRKFDLFLSALRFDGSEPAGAGPNLRIKRNRPGFLTSAVLGQSLTEQTSSNAAQHVVTWG